ncbi:MAG: peptidase [Sandaracinus sp.]|nr:peptidase [Sandaracinus sp.]
MTPPPSPRPPKRRWPPRLAWTLLILGGLGAALVVDVYNALERLGPRDARSLAADPVGPDLATLRQTFQTELRLPAAPPERPPTPPEGTVELVRYPAPLGENLAWVTPPREQAPGPAIVWIIGGFDFGLGDTPWRPAPRRNDQSARAFREAGIVTMYPSLRGFMGNPGARECFYGEVDDILAAARWLATRPDVDPKRVYVGGHSTGGTLALLAVESGDLFRGAVALGPTDDPRGYDECIGWEVEGLEAQVRAPVEHIDRVLAPTVIFEGEHGNADAARNLARWAGEAPVQVHVFGGFDHFDLVAPATEAAAAAIRADRGVEPGLHVPPAEVLRHAGRSPPPAPPKK